MTPKCYIELPSEESMSLIEPPMNVTATMAATAMSARMSAYSASPCPACRARRATRPGVNLTSVLHRISAWHRERDAQPTLGQEAKHGNRKAVLDTIASGRSGVDGTRQQDASGRRLRLGGQLP